jgi:peptide/nickel transport system permease protein
VGPVVTRLILRRFASALPILLMVSLITFALMRLVPGDPSAVIAGLSATPEQVAAIRSDLGLDQPLPVQLWRWYVGLLHGDLGRSLLLGQPVVEATFFRLPVTLALSAYALVITLLLGLASGIIAALRQNSWVDQAAMVAAMFGISMPSFWLGLLMILVFAVNLHWLPTGGYIAFSDDPVGWLRTSTMPAISLALLQAGLLARITRSTMLEVLRQDYIRTARAKGLPRHLVVFKHALANALIPITTVVGITVSLLISASVVTETLFSIPGIGQLLTQAVLNRDYPMVQGGLLIVTGLLVLVNLVVDIGYALLDPRVRYDPA